jgi:anti-sigma regulatory factor (Ser/Thr protein kinase)
LDEVAQFASVVREEGRAAGFGETEVIELELAVVEATNNIIAHGYDGSSGEIEMRVLQDGGVRVELIDSGRPIPAGLLDNPPDVGLDAERGRGLAIIRSCVDYLDYSRREGANQLRLFKARA